MCCLAVSYGLIDLKRVRFGVMPLVYFGTNAITVYVASESMARVLGLTPAKAWLYQNLFANWLSPVNASLAYALAYVFVFFLLVRWMYKQKIFIKI